MATHQCTWFNNNAKLCHKQVVKRICKYLLGSMDKGLILKPNLTRGLECYVNADFAGGWSSGDHTNPKAVLSCTGFVIMYAGCPIFWSSKLSDQNCPKYNWGWIHHAIVHHVWSPSISKYDERDTWCLSSAGKQTKFLLPSLGGQSQLHQSWGKSQVHSLDKTYCLEISSFLMLYWWQD